MPLTRQDIPRALRRHGWWFFLGVGMHMAVMLLGSLAGVLLGLRSMVLVSIVGVLAMVAGVTATAIGYRRDIRRARDLRGRLCPRCLYDLTRSPASGACPECGEPYEIGHVVAMWRKADQSYQAKKRYTLAGDKTPDDSPAAPTLADGQEEAAPSYYREPPGAA